MNKEMIRNDFIQAVEDVYSMLFTDGINDGIKLYLLDQSTSGGFYKESKVKRYKKPVLLVARTHMNVTKRKEDTAEIFNHDTPKFTASLKSMMDNNIPCYTYEDFRNLEKSYIEFHGDFYEIKSVKPTTFVGDIFATITFECEQDFSITSLCVVEEEDEENAET